jgi:uncharacterized protein
VISDALASSPSPAARHRLKFWIDLDSTPHVPFFDPIMRRLRSLGYEVVVTARDAYQVYELADLKGFQYRKIGRHHGKNKLAKVVGLFYRACQLLPFARKELPALALSHGSRSQLLVGKWLGIPTVLIDDYEYSRYLWFFKPKWTIVPEAIPNDVLDTPAERVKKYPGIKEDVYAWSLQPDSSIRQSLSISDEQILAVVRPPAREAHYHNPESELLFARAMDRLSGMEEVRVILLPRHKKQEEWVRARWPQWFANQRVTVLVKPVDGLNLLWHADLVIGGGGTMNREAAALGVPVYSVFRGKVGAVDRDLERTGRLTLLETLADVDGKMHVCPRNRMPLHKSTRTVALDTIIEQIEQILRWEQRNKSQS